jgi:hypothetical protein
MRNLRRVMLGPAVAMSLVATAAQAATPVRVVDTPGYEFGSAAGGDWLAWSRGPTLNGDYDLFVRETGKAPTIIEAFRFQEVGNIRLDPVAGDTLVYSVLRTNHDSEIRFYDPDAGVHEPVPAGVNTPTRDEDNPALSETHLLFGRGPVDRSFSTRVVLLDLTTSMPLVLATAPAGGTVTANSVRGDYATYTVCPSTGRCNVFRYNITTGGTVKMPNPRRANYWSTVTDGGTVYFAQGSPRFCGPNTRIKKWTPGSILNLYTFPRGIEIADLDAVDGLGDRFVYFTRINCPNNFRSGIWRIRD